MSRVLGQNAQANKGATDLWPHALSWRLICALAFWLCLAVLGSVALSGSAWAQERTQQQIYLEDWQNTALRAERAIDSSRASTAAFEQLRKELAEFRQQFQAERSKNTQRIQTLNKQIEALGAAPVDGESEPEDIAILRSKLTLQLNQLNVPRIVAEQAFSRADGLVSEVDTIIRERRTRYLLERGPSPLNPELWPAAFETLFRAGRTLWLETSTKIGSDTTIEKIWGGMPDLLALVFLGSFLLFWGRSWAHRLGDHLRGLGRGLVLLTMSSLVFGSDSSLNGILAQGVGITEMNFSRQQESEADRFGIMTVNCAYGHVAGITDFFSKILPEQDSGTWSRYFASHPETRQRIAGLNQMIREKGYTDGKLTPIPPVLKSRKP